LAPILLKTALTYNIFSVKEPENQAARYLAFEKFPHFRVLRGLEAINPDSRHLK